MSKNDKEVHPKVFISYSQDSPEHADKVLQFANKLRSEGINAILDQNEESPADGRAKWMDRQIESSDFILVVFTERYCQKVMGKAEGGLDEKWESILTYKHLDDARANSTRFIPVLFRGERKDNVAKPFAGIEPYRVDAKKGYENLCRLLTGQQKTEKPGLEKLKSLGDSKPKINSFTDTGGSGDESEEMISSDSVKKGGISEGKRSMSEKLYYIVGIPAAIAVIFSVAWTFYYSNKKIHTPLKATVVDCGHWKAPFYVEEELKGMQRVSYACESFQEVMSEDDTLKIKFPKVYEISSEIISEIDQIEPCEADNVSPLKSIYSILVKNNGSRVCKDLRIIFKDAKYIEFKKEGEERQKFQDRINVEMGDLNSSLTIKIYVWATCSVEEEPEFKIISRGLPAKLHFN